MIFIVNIVQESIEQVSVLDFFLLHLSHTTIRIFLQ